MKTSSNNIEEVFEFKGNWDLPSKCGIKRINKNNKHIVIVTELYQDNPGSSITSATASLAMQIVERYKLDPVKMVYIESSPEMNSKLSFYSESDYLVEFDIENDKFTNPRYKKLSMEEMKNIIG